jgi:hypothetical protein
MLSRSLLIARSFCFVCPLAGMNSTCSGAVAVIA